MINGCRNKKRKGEYGKGKPALPDQTTGKAEAHRDLVRIPDFSTNEASRMVCFTSSSGSSRACCITPGRWAVHSPSSYRAVRALLPPNPVRAPREWPHLLTVITVAKPSDSPASTQWHKQTKSSGIFPQPRRLPLTPQMAPVGVEQES